MNDRSRSLHLDQLGPILDVPDMTFISLQTGDARSQLKERGEDSRPRIIDASGELADFVDTGALLLNLDLLISVDTAPVHLAGALARPVWTLLSFCPDWRWLADRMDTPWYPTMRLFRQSEPGEWGPVVDRIATDLRIEMTRR